MDCNSDAVDCNSDAVVVSYLTASLHQIENNDLICILRYVWYAPFPYVEYIFVSSYHAYLIVQILCWFLFGIAGSLILVSIWPLVTECVPPIPIQSEIVTNSYS